MWPGIRHQLTTASPVVNRLSAVRQPFVILAFFLRLFCNSAANRRGQQAMAKKREAGELPQSSVEWDALIAGLTGQRDAVETELAGIADARRPDALGAMTGDAKAAARVLELNGREAELRGTLATLEDALADAGARRAAAAEAEGAAAAAARKAEAARIARELLAADRQVEEALEALGAALRTRHALVRALAGHGMPERRLSSPARMAAAATRAGVAGFLPMERTRSASLEETDRGILGALLGAVPAGEVPAEAAA
jgi:hypothetical protein